MAVNGLFVQGVQHQIGKMKNHLQTIYQPQFLLYKCVRSVIYHCMFRIRIHL